VRLREFVADLGRRLEAVPDGPSEETVHRLRTNTRRSGALLQSLLASRRSSRETRDLHRDADKLLRQWKKLRQAAGEVRDLDVQRDLLAKLRATLAESAAAVAKDPANILLADQLHHLDAWLHHEREKRAEQLRREVAKRAPRCAELAPKVLAALEKSAPRQTKHSRRQMPAALALEDFFHTSYAMPKLDDRNLHDFRKRTKEARYVAEAGGAEPHAAAVASALKRIQDAIGSWHDLDALEHEAAEALGNSGVELGGLLSKRARQQLQQALSTAERQRQRLLGERLAVKAERRQRKPPVSSIGDSQSRRAVR
jgi:CHAD domain-containing protein